MTYTLLFPFDKTAEFDPKSWKWSSSEPELEKLITEAATREKVARRMRGSDVEQSLPDLAVAQVCRLFDANVLTRPQDNATPTEILLGILSAEIGDDDQTSS